MGTIAAEQSTTHFTRDELKCKCGCDGCNMTVEALTALEALRELAGEPIKVNSAYRCLTHNAGVSVVKNSVHPLGEAIDWKIPGRSLQYMYELALRISAFSAGGIGAYEGGYMHTDVRENGMARWAFTRDPGKALRMVGIDRLVKISRNDKKFYPKG